MWRLRQGSREEKLGNKMKKTLWILLCVMCLAGCQKNIGQEIEVSGNLPTVKETPEASPTAAVEPTVTNTPTPTAGPKETLIPTPTATNTPTPTPEPLDITICFSGDVSLADSAVTTKQLEAANGVLSDCISQELLDVMLAADVMCINNEFTFSTNGEPMEGKAYTFRAHPERVAVLQQMGVDLAMLANNHVYDYGEISLLDTLDTLETAGIASFGAGRNLSEAMEPYYVEIDGITIAFVAASRAEKYKVTPQATEDSAGILRCYDTKLFLEVIREADANADVVLACVHWGTEYSTVLEEVQLETGKLYLDAGADAIIGSHSHCLQGMEFYNGKPIVYSLGNFWFNVKTLDTMLLQLRITGEREEPKIEVSVIPALQKDSKTTILMAQEDKENLYEYLERISINITIDENGVVTQDCSE